MKKRNQITLTELFDHLKNEAGLHGLALNVGMNQQNAVEMTLTLVVIDKVKGPQLKIIALDPAYLNEMVTPPNMVRTLCLAMGIKQPKVKL